MSSLRVENLTAGYSSRNVLENISFTAKKGETVAFIGSTGSGKSTLINLIPRFYDATEGEVLVDGVNVLYKLSLDEISAVTGEKIVYLMRKSQHNKYFILNI